MRHDAEFAKRVRWFNRVGKDWDRASLAAPVVQW